MQVRFLPGGPTQFPQLPERHAATSSDTPFEQAEPSKSRSLTLKHHHKLCGHPCRSTATHSARNSNVTVPFGITRSVAKGRRSRFTPAIASGTTV
jgi:hypothetical protein